MPTIDDSIAELWEKVRAVGPLDSYTDEEWCEETSDPTIYFLIVLTWGGWNSGRQQQVQLELLQAFAGIAKPIDRLDPSDLRGLGAALPYRWQSMFLESLASYLLAHELTFREFCDELRSVDPSTAVARLQAALETEAAKIPCCFLRDCLRLDVFPVDRRIRKVLRKRNLPTDSRSLSEACGRLGIPTRVFARALYDRAASLDDHSIE